MSRNFPRLPDPPTPADIALVLLFTVLWVLDTVFTIIFTMLGGLELEANPLLQYVITYTGYQGFVFVKLIPLVLWLMFAYHARLWIHVMLNAIMVTPVLWGGIMAWGLLQNVGNMG